jgi:general stress protein 26
MTFKFSLTVSDNLQIFGFFLLKSVSRAKNSVWTSGVNDFYPQCLQTAPRVKIIHFTPSVHNMYTIFQNLLILLP